MSAEWAPRANRLSRPLASALFALGLVATGCADLQGDDVVERRIVRLSAQLGINLRYIDPAIRPQDDLYRHVNGNWLANASLPPNLSTYGTFTEVASISDFRIGKIVREIADSESHAPGSANQKIADLYRSTLALVSGEVAPSLAFLAPYLDHIAEISTVDDLWRTIGMLQALGVEAPVLVRLRPDLHDPFRYQLRIEPAEPTFPNAETYRSDAPDSARAAYCEFIKIALTAARPGRKPNCEPLLEFEATLLTAKAAPADARRVEFIDNRFDRAGLSRRWPKIEWTPYFDTLGVGALEDVNITDLGFIGQLEGLSEKKALALWQDYLTVRLVDAFAGYLSGPLYDAWFAFERGAVRGVAKDLPARIRALSFVNEILGFAVGEIYLERYYVARTGTRAKALAETVKRAMASNIRRSDWLSEATKGRALAKLAELEFHIGGPTGSRNFAALDIRPGDGFGNLLRAKAFQISDMLKDLDRPVRRDRWPIKPQSANAFYEPSSNRIFVPAAILRPPFFKPGADEALNYGALGGIIGHELMHAFDDQGRKFNGEGRLEDWWTAADVAELDRRIGRLVAQLEDASADFSTPLVGALVVGEAMSDLAGLAAAFRGYRRATNHRTRARRISQYSGDQRFFLAWAQVWRRMHSDQEEVRRLSLDEHPPAELRVNLTVSNLAGFYFAFQTRRGDQMFRPKEARLSIW